jgi:hypothetical protein
MLALPSQLGELAAHVDSRSLRIGKIEASACYLFTGSASESPSSRWRVYVIAPIGLLGGRFV